MQKSYKRTTDRRTVTLFTLTVAALLCYAPMSSAMVGGTLLSGHQERIGIFQIRTYDALLVDYPTGGGRCTATVLYSSQSTNRSWLVTAAHCFSYRDDLFFVYGHFTNPKAAVIYDLDTDTSGTNETSTPWNASTVYVHPEWLSNGGHTAWFGPRDMAFIRVDMAIPIVDAAGVRIHEFRRPIYTGSPSQVSAPYSSASMENFSRIGFCGQGSGDLRCDLLSNIWFSPNFRHQFFQLPAGAWKSGFYEAGDSGGPLLKYAPGLNRQWEGAAGVTDVAMYGAVLGVLQGPTVWCDYIQNGNCNPSDGLATRFEGVDDWLEGRSGSPAVPYESDIPRISTWTFANRFRAAVGETTTLTAIAQNSYTFPAYVGKIVGIGIDKSTNRLHTWYDNGFMTIGTRFDLDVYSQVVAPAPLPDLMPTRSFSGAPGRTHSQIVAMMISPLGHTHAWYADGTFVIGSIADLDSIQPAEPYRLPPGKSPSDVVAIASRPAGGVFAYYRDGTVSEGLPDDLDVYSAPRPFLTGNGRVPGEILGIDTLSDGRSVTVFDQSRLY